MKSIGELTAAIPRGSNTVAPPLNDPAHGERDSSPARYVFLRMHGAYGAQWLDKWRTGLLDSEGKDRGVISVMAQWSVALAPYSREVIAKACDVVLDRERRRGAEYPPSMPEFIAECKALVPRVAPPLALPNLMNRAEQQDALRKLAEIKAAKLAEQQKIGPLERLQDVIVEAYRLAGGQLEDLTQWSMTRQLGD